MKYFGPLLKDSWAYALETGRVTSSHESSYLKLLPKEGKDAEELKNWRPITLSNCDLKLITKCYTKRLTSALEPIIGMSQTAYIRGRQITDNLMLIINALELYPNLTITSLDAEKAFDSIKHWFIKETLKHVGLQNFIKIFDTLYMTQRVDIILNLEQIGCYNIKNGVKQGDSLSCILFILGIETLLRKIESDNNITAIEINKVKLPKAVAYADDITCLTPPGDIAQIFRNYATFTYLSGLKVNADKTEILNKVDMEVNFSYQRLVMEELINNGQNPDI